MVLAQPTIDRLPAATEEFHLGCGRHCRRASARSIGVAVLKLPRAAIGIVPSTLTSAGCYPSVSTSRQAHSLTSFRAWSTPARTTRTTTLSRRHGPPRTSLAPTSGRALTPSQTPTRPNPERRIDRSPTGTDGRVDRRAVGVARESCDSMVNASHEAVARVE